MSKETATKSNSVSYKDMGLDSLISLLGNDDKLPELRIGIIGDQSKRKGNDGPNNAEIGAIHELGLGQPVRSFLRMPLIEKSKSALENSGAFDKEVIQKEILKNGLASFMSKIGVVLEEVVQRAFDTNGYGKWKPSDMSKKKNHQTLVETQQLRNSIISKVIEK